jgi:hypothetical protein
MWFDKTLSRDIYPFVGSTAHRKVHRSPGNPKEIPTWASRVSNYSYFPWFNRQHTWRSQRQVRRCRRRRNFIYYMISNIFAKPQVFYYLVSDAKIFDIIYQLSPLLDCDPTVCLSSGDLTFLWETNRRVTLQQGWCDNCIIRLLGVTNLNQLLIQISV